MARIESDSQAPAPSAAAPHLATVVERGRKQLEELTRVQKEFLGSFEEMRSYWWSRMQDEAKAGTELFAEIAASKSLPEALAAGQDWTNRLLQRMADDGKHFVADTQKCVETEMRLMSKGWQANAE